MLALAAEECARQRQGDTDGLLALFNALEYFFAQRGVFHLGVGWVTCLHESSPN